MDEGMSEAPDLTIIIILDFSSGNSKFMITTNQIDIELHSEQLHLHTAIIVGAVAVVTPHRLVLQD